MQPQLASLVGHSFRQDVETGFHFCLAARETGFEESESVAPLTGLIADERKTLDSFEQRINDKHFAGGADRDGARRLSKLPPKAAGLGEPDVPRSRKRLSERFQSASLEEIGGPGLDVGLFGEPCRNERVGLRRRFGARNDQEEGDENPMPHHFFALPLTDFVT